MLNDPQLGKYRMYAVFGTFLDKFSARFKGFKLIVPVIASFLSNWAKLKALVPSEASTTTDSKPITQAKDELFSDMKAKAIALANLAKAWASDAGKTDTAALFTVVSNDFKAGEPDQVAKAKDILKHLNDNKNALVADADITEDRINDLADTIDKADKSIGKPTTVIISNSQLSDDIENAFKAVDDDVAKLKTRIKAQFGKGQPAYDAALIKQLLSSAKVIVPKRDTDIEVEVIDAVTQKPIAGATVTAPALNKSGESNPEGKAVLKNVRLKQDTAQVAHPAYKPAAVPVKAVRGRATSFRVELTPL